MRDKRVDLSRRNWLIGFIIFVLLVTTVPYLVGILAQGDHWRFSGFLFGVEDGNSYLAKMHAGLSGEWLFKSPYTSSTYSGVLAFLPYMMLGKIAILPIEPHLQLVVLFHLVRWISTIAMILATFHFSTMYFAQSRWVKWVIAIIVMGGGLGWVLFLLPPFPIRGWMPLSFISPESFTFLYLFGLPHLAMARALLLGGWIFFVSDRPVRGGLKASAFWVLMSLFQPLSLLIVWAVLVFYAIITLVVVQCTTGLMWEKIRKILIHTGIPVVSSTPIMAYYYFLYRNHPYISAWKSQSFVLALGVDKYFLAYGLLLPFVVIAFIKIDLLSKPANRLLIAWGMAFPVLISLPYNYQRRLAEGFWVVIVILAFLGVSEMNLERHKGWHWVFILLLIAPVLFLGGSVINVLNPASPIYQTATTIEAFNAVRTIASSGDVVISALDTGNPLPAFAPVHVVLGHRAETVPFHQVQEDVERVFQKDVPLKIRKEILAQYHVDYVFWGPNERALGGWEPDPDQGYKLEYQKGEYRLYKVTFSGEEGE